MSLQAVEKMLHTTIENLTLNPWGHHPNSWTSEIAYKQHYPMDEIFIEPVKFETEEGLTISAVYVEASKYRAKYSSSSIGRGLHDVALPRYAPGRFTVILSHGNMASAR